MRILVATAVPAERDAVARAFPGPATEIHLPAATLHRFGTPPHDHTYDLLAAGVGPALAAASTAGALTAAVLAGRPYGLVVSAGIAGGFAPGAPLGSLVLADEITAADLGAETPDGFLPVTDLGFGTVTHRPPPALVRAAATATGARTGTVLTVSTVTGGAERASALRTRHPRALAEAMEGFGVAEAAAAHTTPVLELRAVSNPVGPRDRAAWRIGDALTALTDAFGKLTPVLESWNPHDAPHDPRHDPREP
ncbi:MULTISPECIES: futalosine hydrolase [Streptomyces]|uniref:Futalosine hydrolase n=1 Tax=Streptomyces griseiscabiei TaxID=2993540 RepID=A0ABU4LI98_9ACTN|nr:MULTISPECIES: futalosine hydrolase [Streptomyces]MBZ3908027.1 futalosine hydrolase [Streptomyces griseiscabiei]MDX2915547.1 futalosine hydrolase [Streptomyces griseiscabiei]